MSLLLSLVDQLISEWDRYPSDGKYTLLRSPITLATGQMVRVNGYIKDGKLDIDLTPLSLNLTIDNNVLHELINRKSEILEGFDRWVGVQ